MVTLFVLWVICRHTYTPLHMNVTVRYRTTPRVCTYVTTPSLPLKVYTCTCGSFVTVPHHRYLLTYDCFTIPLRHQPPPTSTRPHTTTPVRRPRETASPYRNVTSSILRPGVLCRSTRRLRSDVRPYRFDPGTLSGRLSFRELSLSRVECTF